MTDALLAHIRDEDADAFAAWVQTEHAALAAMDAPSYADVQDGVQPVGPADRVLSAYLRGLITGEQRVWAMNIIRASVAA